MGGTLRGASACDQAENTLYRLVGSICFRRNRNRLQMNMLPHLVMDPMPVTRRAIMVSVLGLTLMSATSVLAKRGRSHDDYDHDYEAADSARRSGEVWPLQEILDEIERQIPGEVVGIEFERKQGVWVYEIKKLTQSGQYVEIYVDAGSKQILKIEGK